MYIFMNVSIHIVKWLKMVCYNTAHKIQKSFAVLKADDEFLPKLNYTLHTIFKAL